MNNLEKDVPKEVWPVMLTPFTTEGIIDIDALRKLTDFYIETGSTGLFANCLSSEMFHLSDDERITITQTVVDHVNGRQPVVATGNFSMRPFESIEFIKRLVDTGVNEVILNSALLGSPTDTDDVLRKNVEQILSATDDISYGVYECPVPFKRIVSLELMTWMAETGRFSFLKSTSCDLDEIKSKLAAVGQSRVKINNANIPTALGSLRAGANGVASIASNFYPELISFLAVHANHSEEVMKVHSWLCVADTLIHQYYPMSAKYFLGKRNIKIELNTRVETGRFTYQDYIKFDQLLEGMKYMAEQAGVRLFDV